MNLTHDYAYNEKYDKGFVNGLNLGNITINGNNHTIDFKNKTFAWVNSTDLTIKDLKLINYYNEIDTIINELNRTKEDLIQANKQIDSLKNQVKTLNSKITKLNAELTKAKQVIKIKTVKSAKKVKRTSKKFTITATLNKKLKNKKVFFNFNGKIYTRKTNYKGVATLKVTKSVLKKLKVGKLTYNVIFGERMLKRTIRILK